MVQRVGGLTHRETEQLCRDFVSLGDTEDMANKIRSVEGLRHPTFPALLSKVYLEPKGSADPGVKSRADAFETKYEAFFSVLHTQLYASRLASAGIQPDRAAASKRVRMDIDRLAAFVVCREDLIVAALVRLLEITPTAQVSTAIGTSLGMCPDTIHLRRETYSDMAQRLFDPATSFAAELAPLLAALHP